MSFNEEWTNNVVFIQRNTIQQREWTNYSCYGHTDECYQHNVNKRSQNPGMSSAAIYIKFKNCKTNQAARSQNSGYTWVGEAVGGSGLRGALGDDQSFGWAGCWWHGCFFVRAVSCTLHACILLDIYYTSTKMLLTVKTCQFQPCNLY